MKTTQILSHENLPPVESAGEGEVGGCTHKVQTAWLLLSLAVESRWLALGGPFLSSFAPTDLDNGLLAM